ncbi:acetate/propionate family kinase [Chitinimonas arctica]|uniref:Acetate kinase n=1 Tax=Chitinimonas arctica TaxID=2594795 RepID=A0A516SC21_9NEIS|nr:acetate/propionate family kinase [Chitinimonas arctica]QDQ25618.1 acetate/propionate family kinase [Chitinimonas arctica]
MSGVILVLNCGSSSIKFALFDAATDIARTPRLHGKVDGVTEPEATLTSQGYSQALILGREQPYHHALTHIISHVERYLADERLVAVAHRVVHGGTRYTSPVLVDAAVLADLRSYIPLAPLHQPFALEAMEILLSLDPVPPQIACFDTAFHHTLPDVERMLPLPWSAWERGLRRYGFHGLSYEYQSIVLAERYGDAARGRTIIAHLGSGASLCAMQNLRSVATTMGFSALDGLMMGTRCGALDPGALLYLMEIDKLSPAELGRQLYHESGLLGVSGHSADPRALLEVENSNAQARAALALYIRRIVREIGALVAVLGGLEMLVFTAGVGEHNATIRQRICQGFAYLGLAIDDEANGQHAYLVSTSDSRVKVAVEPSNEEWVAACKAANMLPHLSG